MQQTHHVQHPVVIPAIPIRHRSIPKRIHKLPRLRLILRRKTRHRIRPHQPNRAKASRSKSRRRSHRLPIQRINRTVLIYPLSHKKRLYPVAQHPLRRSLLPPRPVHRPIARRPPRVIPKLPDCTNFVSCGVPSKFAYTGASPVFGFVVFTK